MEIKESSSSDSDSEDTASSSSSEEEDRCKWKEKKKFRFKNIIGLCVMGYSSRSKPGSREDSDSDSEDEVNRDPESLLKENAELNDLLVKCDEKLRKAKKKMKEHRKLLDKYAEKIGI